MKVNFASRDNLEMIKFVSLTHFFDNFSQSLMYSEIRG